MAGQHGTSQDQTVDPGIDERLQIRTIAETLAKLKECSLFHKMVERAGLQGTLGHSGLYTLFAPNNAALGKNSPSDPQQFLEQHLLSGAMRSDDLQRLQNVKTIAGGTVPVSIHGATIRVGNATINRADIQCTNGVIHAVSANLADTTS